MIKLTIHNDAYIYLNPDRIDAIMENEYAIYDNDDPFDQKVVRKEVTTKVICGYEKYDVTESPEMVATLITEAKHRKMNLQAAYTELYRDASNIHSVCDALEAEDMP